MKVRQTSLERRRPAARAGIGHGMVRVGILAEIPALVRHLGHDPLPLLHEAGVDPALLHDPDNPIAFLTGGITWASIWLLETFPVLQRLG